MLASQIRGISHVALLLPSVDKAARALKEFPFAVGDAENWEGEGTREIYVERERRGSLLLMEAAQPGAYQRAIQKRGPGLHHIAIDVENVETFADTLAGSGWLLHPSSLRSLAKSRTIYLGRPGFPALIEVQEGRNADARPEFVQKLVFRSSKIDARLLAAVGLSEALILRSAEAGTTPRLEAIVADGHTIAFADLCR